MTKQKKHRILILDDEKDITIILKMGLERKGFEVSTFNDPVEAKSAFKTGEYDLLLLDIRIPRLNGFELYCELLKIDPNVKVCFITAFEIYYDEFRTVFPKLKVNCIVRKPVSIEELAKLILEELEGNQELQVSEKVQKK